MVADEVTTVPEKEGVAAEDDEVGGAQTHSFGKPGSISGPLRSPQSSGIRLECSRLPHEAQNDSYLHHRLLTYSSHHPNQRTKNQTGGGEKEDLYLFDDIPSLRESVLGLGGQLGQSGGVDAANDGD